MSPDGRRKLAPNAWEPYFLKARVRVEDLESCKSKHSKAIKIGHFLSPNVNREVPIEVKGRTGKATLRVEEERAKQKCYFFEVVWDDTAAAGSTKATATKKKIVEKRSSKKKNAAKAKKAKSIEPAPSVKCKTKTKHKPTKRQGSGNEEEW